MSKTFNIEVHYVLRSQPKVDFHRNVEATTATKAKSKALAHYGKSSITKVIVK